MPTKDMEYEGGRICFMCLCEIEKEMVSRFPDTEICLACMEGIMDTLQYEVQAISPNGDEECVGVLELPEIKTVHDMPVELEIDGVTYYPQF